MSPIIEHPDVQAHAADHAGADPRGARDLLRDRAAIDRSQRATDEPRARPRHERASLLTPVAKAFSTDIGIEVASLGVQVHGGMGFIEETGAAQHYRDARIAPIYEGTNGIQAIDLVTRKLPLSGGAAVRRLSGRAARDRRGREGRQRSGVRRDRRAACRGGRQPRTRDAMAARRTRPARPTRRSPARRRICGCSAMPPAAARSPTRRSPAIRLDGNAGDADAAGRTALARFFAENIAVQASGLERSVTEGADPLTVNAALRSGVKDRP